MKNSTFSFEDLGKISYKTCWDYQEKLLQEIVAIKLANRKTNTPKPTPNYLLFCEHTHVYTLGKSGSETNLLLNKTELAKQNIEYFKINRGGDITYHGPGQIVGYPIIDLANFHTDLGKYLRTIEEVIIATLADYNLTGYRINGATGVWLGEVSNPRKVCAIGVRASRWVTMHGWAFNINTNLNYFENIIPCGITDKGVTSLQSELNRTIDEQEVKQKLLFHFQRLFKFEKVNATA